MADLVGEKLGRYEITARLASGALAEVYRAHSSALDREVALKVYRPHVAGDQALTERLRSEARRVAALRHTHIAQIYDCDVATVAGQPLLYVISELAEGATLKEQLETLKASGQVMPLTDVTALARAIASALDYAHGRGVIHGGLKPANILFTAEGEPLVADFGVARVAGATLQALPTDPAGAPAYMAPEQIRGDPIDRRTDVYSLGVLLYELCTGALPFTAETATGVMMRHLTEPPRSPAQTNPALPPAMAQVILKALSKSPADRYPTAGELATVLEAALSDAAAAVPPAAEAVPKPAASPAKPKAGPIIAIPSFLRDEATEIPAIPASLAGKSAGAGREGIRNFLLGLIALFTAALTLIEKFVRAVDIMRNPLIGFILVGVAVTAMIISAGYVISRPQLYKRWQRRLAAAGLVLTVLAAVGWGGWTIVDMKRPPKGLIVLIADFERDPDAHAVNYARRIETGLNEALGQLKVEGVYVERAYEVYTEKDARTKAAAHKAAVVIYGWYDDAGVIPRFELVRAPQPYLPLLKQTVVALADMDKLEIRVDRELKEMSYIAAATIGLVYYADGQNNQALTFFDLALRSAPEDTQMMGREAVYFYKGSSHFLLYQFPQALAALQEVVRINPDLHAGHRNLAIAYGANCDYTAALQETDEALRLKPDSSETYYYRGALLMSRGRWDEAAADLAKAAELSPNDAAVQAALGQTYKEIGRTDEAAAAFRQAASLSEGALKDKEKANDPEAIAAHADALWSGGQLDEAVTEYQRAIQQGEKRKLRSDRLAWLYRSLGRAYWDMERWSEMADAYNKAITLAPGLCGDHSALGSAYQGMAQPDQAVAAYQQALVLCPCDANLHNLLADLYRESGRTDEALQEYRLAAQYDPDDFTAWNNIGMILEQRGETVEAKTAYEKAVTLARGQLERNPHDASTASMLGLMYLWMGDVQGAIPILQQAITLRPDADSHYALGNAYYEAGKYEKALVEYQAALAIDPKHVSSAVRLGDTYAGLGQTDKAIAAYRQALTLEESADVHAYLGMLLARQGQTEQAEAEYQASLRLEDNIVARLGLAALRQAAGRTDEAIAEYQAILLLADDPYTRFNLAKLYEAQGRLEDAAREYRAAVPLYRPDDLSADSCRAALASVLLRLCRADEALSAMEPALKEDAPPSFDALSTLAAIYKAQGKVTEAGETYAALLQEQPDHAGAHYLAAWFAYQQDRLDEAVSKMARATQLAPAFSLAWSSLGYFYDEQGDLTAAKTAYEKALAVMPSNVNALLGLGALALQQGNPAAALSNFLEALRQQPEYVKALPDETNNILVSAHLNLFLAYERLGRAEEAGLELAAAQKWGEKTVAALPSHPQARFQLAVTYWLASETEKAEAAYAEAARCDASQISERQRMEKRILKLRGK